MASSPSSSFLPLLLLLALLLLLQHTTTAFFLPTGKTMTTTTTTTTTLARSRTASPTTMLLRRNKKDKSSSPTSSTGSSSTSLPMSKDLVGFGEDLDGSTCRIGIVKTRWNPQIVDSLYDGVRTALKECGVKDANIYDTTVPGSFELPLAARFLALSRQCDVVITIGCLIKGETMHFEYIAEAVAKGLMDIQLQTTIPVIFGLLTVLTEEQAISRSQGDNNHGVSWGKTAVEMALLRNAALSKGPDRATLPLTEGQKETPAEKKQERKFGF